MSVADSARALGGEAHGQEILCPGPNHSPRDRSLSVRLDADAPDGFVVFSFTGDDPMACRDHVRAALGMPAFDGRQREVQHKPRPKLVRAEPEKPNRNAHYALRIWAEADALPGTLAERYLHHHRGIDLERVPGLAHVLKFHPRCPWERERLPCLITLMTDPLTAEATGIQRTALRPDGSKIDRKMLGPAGIARLIEDAEVTAGLGISEGAETALSIMQAGWKPVWACLSSSAVSAFPVLPGIECLTVFADRDENGAGERAAHKCCTRWTVAGRTAVAIRPTFTGDWNDIREVSHG